MRMDDNIKTRSITAFLLIFSSLFFTSAYAAETGGIGWIAENVISNLNNLGRLITAAAYVAGMGFAIGAVMKFKAHKDNPTQIPVGTPIALIFIAAALIFLPNIFLSTGKTLFGEYGAVAGPSGSAVFTSKLIGDNLTM